jgi:glycosyltransferase involved in cell wall biosynthesis
MNQSITFIIPTIGRNTLEKAIQSIEKQTNNNWKIIIIFDGIQSTLKGIRN